MKKRIARLLIGAVLTAALGMAGVPNETEVSAKGKVYISAARRSYFLHDVWDKLTLKNVPTGARIRWESSNKSVVRIRETIPNGIWYQVKRDGKATITATFDRKKYRCRIRVKRETEDMVATQAPAESNPLVTPVPSDPGGQTSTETPAQSFPPSATPVSTAKPVSTIVPATVTPTPTASVSPNQEVYDRRIADFKERYISEDMTDYDKVDAICRFISNEFDYGKEANWFSMVVKGYGDCMASRIGVNRLCTELGIASYICRDLNDHGETMVRIGDTIYMTVTGYGGEKPRLYRIYPMSEAELAAKIERYPSCRHFLGLEYWNN